MPVSLMAKGTINVCRFVKIDTTNTTTGGFHAVQCTGATDKPFGISQEASNSFPVNATNDMGVSSGANYAQVAAADGQAIRIFGVGEECLLYAGAAVPVGADLVSDSAGMGVQASFALPVAQWIGARALQGAAAQYEKIRVMVLAYGTGSGS